MSSQDQISYWIVGRRKNPILAHQASLPYLGYSTHPFPYATTEPKENRTVINQGLQHLSNRPTSLLVYKIQKKGIKK
jgi:hypothetical protein